LLPASSLALTRSLARPGFARPGSTSRVSASTMRSRPRSRPTRATCVSRWAWVPRAVSRLVSLSSRSLVVRAQFRSAGTRWTGWWHVGIGGRWGHSLQRRETWPPFEPALRASRPLRQRQASPAQLLACP